MVQDSRSNHDPPKQVSIKNQDLKLVKNLKNLSTDDGYDNESFGADKLATLYEINRRFCRDEVSTTAQRQPMGLQ